MTCLSYSMDHKIKSYSVGKTFTVKTEPIDPFSYLHSDINNILKCIIFIQPRKAKRQPSFSGIGGGNGLVLSKSNNLSNANNHNTVATPKLYPKAIANEYDSMGTLKRHSNQPNHRNNLDIEEDKFY